jgi:hypothetical protein
MKAPVDCARPIEEPKAPRIPAKRTRFATNRRQNNQFRSTMEPPVPLGSVEKATRYIIQRSHRPMADKAPKFARTPLSDPSDLPGACHLLARRFQPGLPALGGGLSGAWHLLGRGGSAWFASIGRRSARCLAPVGRAVDSGARNASTVWRQVATAKSQPSAAKRWTAARERIHRLATGGYPRQVATPGQVATARTGGYRPGLQLTHSVRIANLDA